MSRPAEGRGGLLTSGPASCYLRALSFAMDLTPLVDDEKLDVLDYTLGFLRRFEKEVRDRFARLG